MKLFIVTYGGGHAKIIEKVVKEIDKRDDLEYELLALTVSVNYFEKKGIRHKKISDYKSLFNFDSDLVNMLIPPYKKNDFVPFDEHYIYNYLSISDLLNEYSQNKVIEVIKEHGRRVYYPVSTMMKILEVEKPDAVLITSSPRMERSTIEAARNLGILSFSIEDLFAVPRAVDGKIDLDLDVKRYSETFADIIFVMNNIVKENLLGQNIDDTRVIVTGNPNFDGIINQDYSRDTEFENQVDLLSKGRRILTFLTQQTDSFDEIMKVLYHLPENKYFILVKLHPNQQAEYSSKENLIITSENLYSCIHVSNLCITEYSTTGLECLLLSKKLLVIESDEGSNVIPFSRFKNAFIVDTVINLTLSNIQKIEEIEEVDFDSIQKGNSAFKIVNSIEKMLGLKCKGEYHE